MFPIGAHSLIFAALAALALPIVVFYFLKLRRPRVELPSLVLWRQVMSDQRVNAPFQRFRRNLLLWLQLLILLLLVLAGMQLYWRGGAGSVDRMPVLIDVSASMGARTTAGGKTRLDEAKAKVRELIANLARDQELCLIAMGDEARRLTGFSNDRRELDDALTGLAVEDVAANPAAALQLAQAIGRSTPFERALLISDGNLPDLVDADLAFHLDYQRVAAGGANLGITACSAQRRGDGRWDVFAAVEASAEGGGSATVELVAGPDHQVLASQPLAPGPGGVERLAFRVDGGAPVELELRLVCDGFDALDADNHAYLALPRIRPVRALVSPTMPAWRRAVGAQANVELVDGPTGDVDLVVSDRAADLQRPAAVRLGVGVIPADLASEITQAAEGGSAVVDYRRSDALLAHVVLDDLVISERIAWAKGVGEKDLEAKGFTVLVHGDRGPLVLHRRNAGVEDFHLLFHSDRSTMPYRLGFPVLAGNLVALALRAGGQDEVASRHTGLLPALIAPPDREATVLRPDGGSVRVLADHEGVVGGIGAIHPGFYRLRAGGVEQVVGVSLVDSRETRLAAVEHIQVREVAVTAVQTGSGERSLWQALALVALLVALGEWWYGHRRPLAAGEPA